jgi:DNA-binding NarL/FixJ family response regulator
MRVVIFDDVLAARGENWELPGLSVEVHGDADQAAGVVAAMEPPPDLICMDFAMGQGHVDGVTAVAAIRAAGYRGRILAISSDPAANDAMRAVGADESLRGKALLRSYLVHQAGGAAEP